MKTKGTVDILLCFTPFITDERDSKFIKKGNWIFNILFVISIMVSLLSIFLHGDGKTTCIEYATITLLAWIGAGCLIQVFHPQFKSKIGRKEGDPINDDGLLFVDDRVGPLIIACIKKIEDHSIGAGEGMGLAKALKQSGMLVKRYNEGDLAWWLYCNYREKYCKEYAESSIRRPSNPDIYFGRWNRKFKELLMK